ncbi:MAG: hypothetical protein JWR46_1601, partial [Mycobacterium sp.]|nr:hypothetical protein [Mycobacterium sp.]
QGVGESIAFVIGDVDDVDAASDPARDPVDPIDDRTGSVSTRVRVDLLGLPRVDEQVRPLVQ